jgi:RNA polymerase sigma factor (sigma-70 family)
MDFEEAARRHQRRVYTFAHYFLGNREEAEDVTQEVLLRLWRHCDHLEEVMVEAWLLKVTRNACFDLLRRRRLPAHSASSIELLTHEPASREPSPEDQAEDASLSRQLRKALNELEEPYRSALILREIQDLAYHEIATILELPLNTVRVHIHRGRQRLREHFKEAYGDAATH